FTVENIDTFHYRAKNRLIKKGFTNIYFKLGDGTEGWSEYQPYDRIIVTSSDHHVPESLITQLAPWGRMISPIVTPQMQELQCIEKDKQGKVSTSVMYHVAFVRLRGEYE